MTFLFVFLKYVIELAVLAALAGLAIFCGIKLRKNKDAKLAAKQEVQTPESAEE